MTWTYETVDLDVALNPTYGVIGTGSYMYDTPYGMAHMRGVSDTGSMVGYVDYTGGTINGILDVNGTFTLVGPNYSNALGINTHGTIVGGYFDGVQHGMICTSVCVIWDYPDAMYSYTMLEGINDAGVIVGRMATSTHQYGFVDDGGVISVLDMPGGISVYGISADNVVSGMYNDGTWHGFLARDTVDVSEPMSLAIFGASLLLLFLIHRKFVRRS